VTAAAVVPELPGRQADVHLAGSEHAASFPAAGVEAAEAAFAPSGHEPNGQCAGSVQRAVAAGAVDFVAWRVASAVEPLASANATASAVNERMRFIDVS